MATAVVQPSEGFHEIEETTFAPPALPAADGESARSRDARIPTRNVRSVGAKRIHRRNFLR